MGSEGREVTGKIVQRVLWATVGALDFTCSEVVPQEGSKQGRDMT